MIRRIYSAAILAVLAFSGTAKVEAQSLSEPQCYSWQSYFSHGELWLQRKSNGGDIYGRAEITLNESRDLQWEFSGKDLDLVYKVQVSEISDDGLVVQEMDFIKNTPSGLVIAGRSYDLIPCERLIMPVRPISEDQPA
ncbi:MAG: hypothetical protein AAGK66_06815 [Pseudomonadota bacterium]